MAMGMYNTEDSIRGFAEASFKFALDKKWCAAAEIPHARHVFITSVPVALHKIRACVHLGT